MTRILVVEDNPITRKVVLFALEKQGFAVVDTVTGAAAVRAFAEGGISLILVDLLLPDMDGFDLLARLRAMPGGAEVPILAFSGLLSTYDEARVSTLGFDDVVNKPVEPSRLVQIVRGHLPSPEPANAEVGRGRRIVIADDDAVQRKLVTIRLQRAGFTVIATADGEEALERIRADKPDAIVSDVLMPRLDGFGLCMAVRSDPEVAKIPIVLVTNSYLDEQDRSLAWRAGANDMVVRTPELREVVLVLEATLSQRAPARPRIAADPDVERERLARMMLQLERQVALNAGVTQRCALLSAELAILRGISEAVATQHDIEQALCQVLAACFDAGGVSLGALYLWDGAGLRTLRFDHVDSWRSEEVDGFFGDRELLLDAIRSQRLLSLPSDAVDEARGAAVMERARVRSLLVVPTTYKGESLGALLMVSATEGALGDDRVVFAQAVAGQISVALALARAFADKDSSERSARTQARVLRSILESMGEGVLVADEDDAITHWNPATEAIFRTPRPPSAKAWFADRAFGGDRATPVGQAQLPLARAMRGEPVDRMEMFLHRDDGGAWLSVNARPLLDEVGTIRGGVAVIRDVTHEKATAAQLMVSDRMASLGTLAAGVAHEINNPLATLLGNLDLAIKDVGDLSRELTGVNLGELSEELRDAREAAERVRNIVRDLKLFSRADEEARGEVDVHRVLESSLRMAWNEVRHRAKLVQRFGGVPAVYANEARLGQVFLNLIVNAAQAIPEGRAEDNEIRVATSVTADQRVRVDISDTGSGIPPEVVTKLFTPFFTTKPVGVGTGLGLAICHKLIDAVGGQITVDTEVGKGTTFSVFLPVHHGKAAPHRHAPTIIPLARRRGRVLVVDDEVAISKTIRRALRSEHDVVAINDPHEALRVIVTGERFDVILCDLMMPTGTGMELHARLLEQAPDQAANMVFITGGAFTSSTRAFLDEVPNPRLEKPFNITNLRAMVNDRVGMT
ncbi:MAG: response regulator [Deltaproteobacteria bacterium]|nr:response regulator [Deltaproteobacteria bacterium]